MLGQILVRRMSSASYVCKELSIPVPWGSIAAKQWTNVNSNKSDSQGEPKSKVTPWIVIHGWLDNAGSFDTLAPLLVNSQPGHSLLCLDYPGHGLSSHLAPGHQYHYLEALKYIRLVAQHMGYTKFGLMGHSMGAGMCSVFAGTFPEMVEALIMIDLIKPVGRKTDELIEKTRLSVDSFLALDAKLRRDNPEKVYKTQEEALQRLLDGANQIQGEGAVTEESARIILKRGIKPVEGGYIFSRDLRHRAPSLYGYHMEFSEEFCRSIKCPQLLIKASDQPHYEDEEIVNRILDIYKKNPAFEMVNVEGSHHVHLNNPERLMESLNKFMNKNFK